MTKLIDSVSFNDFIEAAMKVSEGHPSTAIMIGYDLTRLASAKLGVACRRKDKEMRAEAKDFLYLLKTEWALRVNRRANEIILERKFNKKKPLPLPEDVQQLALYLLKLLREYEYKVGVTSWRDVAITLGAYLLSYNKRRPGEIEDIT